MSFEDIDWENIVMYTIIIFCILLVLGIIAFFVAVIFIQDIGSNNGQHTGIVTAVEYTSNIFYPATIVYFKTNTESSQEDRYCVKLANLKVLLEQYARTRELITISFQNDYVLWREDCSGGESIIIGVNKANQGG